MHNLFINLLEKKRQKDKSCHLARVPVTGPGELIALYCRVNDIKEHENIKRNEYSVLHKNILCRNYLKKKFFGIFIPTTQTFFNFNVVTKSGEHVLNFAINKNTIAAVAEQCSIETESFGYQPTVDFLIFARNNAFNCERIPVFTEHTSKDVFRILGLAISSDVKHIVSLEKLSEMKNQCSENAVTKSHKLVFRSKITNNNWPVVKEIPVKSSTSCRRLEFIEERGVVGMLKENNGVKFIPIPIEVKLAKPVPALYHYLAQRGVCKNLEASLKKGDVNAQ